jgi:hypothetical protein
MSTRRLTAMIFLPLLTVAYAASGSFWSDFVVRDRAEPAGYIDLRELQHMPTTAAVLQRDL